VSPPTDLPFEAVREAGVTRLQFVRTILETRILDRLLEFLAQSARCDPVPPVVMCSRHPTVFLAGAHLGEIARLDATTCVRYARRGRRVVRALGEYPAPTVAAIDGSCSGGGFDLALGCDAIVAGSQASFQHPGVRRGLVTGWSGTTVLPEWLGSSLVRRALIAAQPLTPGELAAVGLVTTVHGDPVARGLEMARDLAALDSRRLVLWRSLREPGFVDRFRATVVHKL
jgi:enoyl-CoA hydratase/carnithine racemase